MMHKAKTSKPEDKLEKKNKEVNATLKTDQAASNHVNENVQAPEEEATQEQELQKKCEQLTAKLKEQEQEIEKLKSDILYEKAELDNYRKRMFKEKTEQMVFVQKDMLLKFLPVLDNLERALSHSEQCTKETLHEGIKMTLSSFQDVFSAYRVQPFESKGLKFDPDRHDALSKEPNFELEENTVTQELTKGYRIGDRLLRAAQVVVSFCPEKVEASKQENEPN